MYEAISIGLISIVLILLIITMIYVIVFYYEYREDKKNFSELVDNFTRYIECNPHCYPPPQHSYCSR